MATHTSTIIDQQAQQVFALNSQVVYLMGISFLLGSLVTLFILVLLDWVRRGQQNRRKTDAPQ